MVKAPEHKELKTGRMSGLSQKLGFFFIVMSIMSGLLSYTILTGLSPIVPNETVTYWLLGLNVFLVLGMLLTILWEVGKLWQSRRKGTAGARLHIRLVSLFILMTSIPAIMVALFASVSLDRSLDIWFSERTRVIVDNAVAVADRYVEDLTTSVKTSAKNLEREVSSAYQIFETDKPNFDIFVNDQANLTKTPAIYILDKNYTVVTKVENDLVEKYSPPSVAQLEEAQKGGVIPIQPLARESNQFRALVKLSAFPDHFLYIVKFVDPGAVSVLQKSQDARTEYIQYQNNRLENQLVFALMYIGVALIFMFAAIWFGLWFADKMVAPIGRLIKGAQDVSEGDLKTQVPVDEEQGDLAELSRTFNRMTTELETQRGELVEANTMLDHRRRFTETVLAGVSAGVLSLDEEGIITLANRSALMMLGRTSEKTLNHALSDVAPEMDKIFKKAHKSVSGLSQGQVLLHTPEGDRAVQVRIVEEKADGQSQGFVVTFDDMTELVAAQRNSAWADVARRIAHEIKNPLTPIQLSAERLKRRYSKTLEDDKGVFAQCTDTIIRQVGDIGRMVDEFSSFARMPKAVMENTNLVDTIKEAVVLQRVSQSEIDISLALPEQPVMAEFDRRLLSQLLTNLVKNATESVEAKTQETPELKGKIRVKLKNTDSDITIDVVDNGLGFPKKDRQRLFEPYMTTRSKGTGLGLAIVTKIVEEHRGKIKLLDAPESFAKSGALVRITLPLSQGGRMQGELSNLNKKESKKVEAAQ